MAAVYTEKTCQTKGCSHQQRSEHIFVPLSFNKIFKKYFADRLSGHAILHRGVLQQRISVAGFWDNIAISVFLFNGFQDLHQCTRLAPHGGHAVVAAWLCG